MRWWDHWLKNVDNGAMDGPMPWAWIQDSVGPSTAYEERPGRWVADPSWPTPHCETVRRPLGQHRIGAPQDVFDDVLTVQSALSVGQLAGK